MNQFPKTEIELIRALSVEGELPIGIFYNNQLHKKVLVGPSTDETQMRGFAEMARLGVSIRAGDAGSSAEIVLGIVESRARIVSLGTIPPDKVFSATARMLGPDGQYLLGLVQEANRLMDRFCAGHGIHAGNAPEDQQGDSGSDADPEGGHGDE